MKRIIYPSETGIALIIPAPNCGLSLEQIAIKDTPTGLPYLIIDSSETADRTDRNAWEADFSSPDGYGG